MTIPTVHIPIFGPIGVKDHTCSKHLSKLINDLRQFEEDLWNFTPDKPNLMVLINKRYERLFLGELPFSTSQSGHELCGYPVILAELGSGTAYNIINISNERGRTAVTRTEVDLV